MIEETIKIPCGKLKLEGLLKIPDNAIGIVLFAHGSGSSRLSPRNQFVANELNKSNLATLLFDLLSQEEEKIDSITLALRFDIKFLASRLLAGTKWCAEHAKTQHLNIGYFGASTGGAAALAAAATLPQMIKAVVSRGGRPDLANEFLPLVTAPTLLIVGGEDAPVIGMNQTAFKQMRCIKQLEIVPGATHLFEEPGTLEQVATLAKDWFNQYLM